MPTAAELIADVKDGAGDISDATALRYLNRRQRSMNARAGWYRKAVAIGPTVIAQQDYVVAADVDLLFTMTVDGVPYTKRARHDVDTLKVGWAAKVGPGGFFALADDSAGAVKVRLYPTPTVAGLVIEVWAAVAPPAMTTSGTPVGPVIPDDFTDALVEGAIATWLARKDENMGSADRYEARFDNACEELRRRAKRRFRPGGVAVARVLGVNA